MSLLTICQNVADSVGFGRPTSIVNNNDKTAKQLLALANIEGNFLSKQANWQALIEEHTFTLSTSDQDYALPSDFRWIVPNTTWDRDDQRIVLNPITGEEWQYLKGWATISGLNRRARIRGSQLEFEDTITSADNGKTIAFEYLSKYWADVAAGGSPKGSFTIDTDVPLLDEDLFILGLSWRFRRAKGLMYETEYAEYQNILNTTKAADGGARRINMQGTSNVLNNPNVPETGFSGI